MQQTTSKTPNQYTKQKNSEFKIPRSELIMLVAIEVMGEKVSRR